MLHLLYPGLGKPRDRKDLPSDSWTENSAYQRCLGNGLLLVSGSLVILAGVMAGLEPTMRKRFVLIWPDTSGDPWFGGAVCLSAIALAVYLALQWRELRQARDARARLESELEREVEERSVRHWTRLYGLLHVSQLVGQNTDLQSVFDGITEMCVESFNADWVSMMRFEKEPGELVVCAAGGPKCKPNIIGCRNSLTEGIAGWAAQHRRAILLGPDTVASDYPGITLRDATIAGAMVVPIVVRNEIMGVINVSTRATAYDEEDLRTLEVFAENAGTCIRHIEHVTWLRTMVEQLRSSDPKTTATPRRVPEHVIE